jgi:predicted  nucleic acid-binding Zn-ribbon protein
MTTLLELPWGFILTILLFFGVASLGLPSHRRQQLKLAEIKSRSGEEYKALNEQYNALAQETRAVQATMQADIAAIRASVESIEQMMRDVG